MMMIEALVRRWRGDRSVQRARVLRMVEREILIAELAEAVRCHRATSPIERRLVRITAELAGNG